MNIEGIKVFKGNAPGPKVGIMAITHGDEPCGLDAHLWIEEYLEKNSHFNNHDIFERHIHVN